MRYALTGSLHPRHSSEERLTGSLDEACVGVSTEEEL